MDVPFSLLPTAPQLPPLKEINSLEAKVDELSLRMNALALAVLNLSSAVGSGVILYLPKSMIQR